VRSAGTQQAVKQQALRGTRCSRSSKRCFFRALPKLLRALIRRGRDESRERVLCDMERSVGMAASGLQLLVYGHSSQQAQVLAEDSKR